MTPTPDDLRACCRARYSKRPTRHIVRFVEPALGVLRCAIQADSTATLGELLELLGITADRDELEAAVEAVRYPHELDRELVRRVGFAFTCWGSAAVVSLPDLKLKAVRRKA